jgi:acyl-CoA synthetase (NDP forming)
VQRSVYRHADLRRTIHPKSIAIVGVSNKPSGFGARTRQCLAQFAGRVMLVNPKYERLGDEPCYPSVKALPQSPDCVVISAPKDDVEKVLLDCAEAKAGGAIVFASGFAEVGKPETIAQQQRLTSIARETGLRVLGPNSVGIANFLSHAVMMFYPVPHISPEPRARVGLISQTGSLGIAMSQAAETGTAFSHLLTSGNSCDVDVADFVAYLAEDPDCNAIACLFEGLADPTRLMQAAELARRHDKPLLIHKIATGQAGARAAQSHTGALAGANDVYRAAFERMGAVVVEEMEGLVEAAAFFAKMGHPRAPGVAAVSGSGGATVISADKAEKYGVSMPQPSDRVSAVLKQHVPEFGAARNPCDVTAQVNNNPESFVACLDALMSDEQYGALVVPNGSVGQLAIDRARQISDAARKHGKAACVVSISQWLDGPGLGGIETDRNIALFRSMDRCFATLAAWNGRAQVRSSDDRAKARRSDPMAVKHARQIIADARSANLSERASKQLLAHYGVPVGTDRLARTAAEAADVAAQIGFPVALKIESPDIPHKTEVGGVVLNVRTTAEATDAFDRIMQSARAAFPSAKLSGVVVQRMAPKGIEVLIGAHRDPLFGPVVVAGLGGVLVELMADSAIALAPVDMEDARNLWKKLRGFPLLQGYRGAPPVDIELLSDILCRVSELAVDLPEVSGVDVNPVICSKDAALAVDALIQLQPEGREVANER